MAVIDLRQYVVAKNGTWFTAPENYLAEQLTLPTPADSVTLSGPLTLSVTVQIRNAFTLAGSSVSTDSFSDVYSYNLSIPAGNLWTYPLVSASNSIGGIGTYQAVTSRVLIRAAQATPLKAVTSGEDLPCGYAVNTVSNVSQFFPSPCEGCPPGAPVNMPSGGTSLLSGPAEGGCLRPRYFNGMLVTREDLENEQRYFRLKNKMQNRAMGQGVVWGFSLGRTATGVCVNPGYGVDCCGNDIVVTQPYQVTSEALLRDPKAIEYASNDYFRVPSADDCSNLSTPPTPPATSDPCRRMHLLLEYVECPEDPRPVHGDPCASPATSCEMSRIRETARLRLVPPRDYDPTGPIDKFLAIYKSILTGATAQIGPASAPAATSGLPTVAPFTVQITATQSNASQVLTMNTNSSVTGPTLNLLSTQDMTLHVSIQMASGYSMLAGSVTSGGSQLDQAHTGTAALSWTTSLSGNIPSAAFELANLQIVSAANPGSVISGSGEVSLSGVPQAGSFTFFVTTTASNQLSIAAAANPGRLPCLDESCSCGSGPARFPVFPPFLHDDPAHPGSAVDWKILLAAAAYAYYAMVQQRSQNSSTGAQDPQLALARAIYLVLLVVLFGSGLKIADLLRLTQALLCLFRDWCKALLYPGPSCTGDPHGVVIGCATINSGRIVDVDPWGGRRWVVHYPLLSYWGQQFGMVPFDVFASRLFGMICCIARLPVPTPYFIKPQSTNSASGDFTYSQKVGAVTLFSAPSGEIDAAVRNSNTIPASTTTLSLPAFAMALIAGLRSADPAQGAPLALYRLDGTDTVAFVAPASSTTTSSPTETTSPPKTAPRKPLSGADLAARQTVPPLLRTTADALNGALASQLPISDVELPAGAAASLKTGNINALGDLLNLDPVKVQAALGSAALTNQVLRAAEQRAAQVGGVAYEVLATADDLQVQSAGDLQNAAASMRVAAALTRALEAAKVTGPKAAAESALASALAPS